MSRATKTSLFTMMLVAAGCGSSGQGRDSGAGGSSSGNAGNTGSAGRDAGPIVDAPGGFDLVAPSDGIARDGNAGATGSAGVTGTSGTTGAAGVTGGAGTSGAAGRGGATGVAGTTGAAGSTGAGGAPMAGVNLRIFQGDALLLDQGPSCTNDATATGDRWCAFLSLSATQTVNLSVVNVSQAIRGATITCGGTDPNCLLLTSGWAESDDNLHPSLFQGDTLTYFDSSATAYVWRPGMPNARRLIVVSTTTGDLFGCLASIKGTTVTCLRDLPAAMQPSPTTMLVSDVLVGRADGTTNPLLTSVDQAITANMADDADYGHFSYGFPAPGTGNVAWTSRATATGPEILKVKQVDTAAAPTTVATDVHDWDTSPDGSRWYWLSQVNGATLAGTLQTAPFPGGASPASVLANAVQFAFPTASQSLITLTAAGALSGIVDPVGAPATTIPVDTAVQGFLRVSAQGDVGYVKTYDAVNDLTDMVIAKWNAAGTACAASATPTVFYPAFQFSPDSGAGLFPQFSASMFQGVYTRVSDCTNTIVAAGIVALGSLGDRAVMFMDTFNTTTQNGTIRLRNVAAGNTLAAGAATTISADVGTFDSTGPASSVFIYTVNAGVTTDGVFVRYFGP